MSAAAIAAAASIADSRRRLSRIALATEGDRARGGSGGDPDWLGGTPSALDATELNEHDSKHSDSARDLLFGSGFPGATLDTSWGQADSEDDDASAEAMAAMAVDDGDRGTSAGPYSSPRLSRSRYFKGLVSALFLLTYWKSSSYPLILFLSSFLLLYPFFLFQSLRN